MELTAAVMAFYFLAMIAIGLASARFARSLEEFHLAGRRVGHIMLTSTLSATMVGASATLGMAGLGFNEGLTGAWWMLSGTVGLLILSALFAFKIRSTGCSTLPDLVGTFYDDRVKAAASILIIISWIGVISVQIIASGKVLGTLFGGNEPIFIAISAIVFILYTTQGGQHSVVRTDLIQFAIILAGIMLLFFRTLDYAGLDILRGQSFPTSPARGAVGVISLIMVVGSTYLVGPDIYSRIFLASDPNTARRSTMTVAIILVPLAFVITTLGIYARSIFPDILPEQALPVLMMKMLSPAERGIVGAALLAAFMSSAATPLLTATSTMALDLYRRARSASNEQHLMKVSRAGTVLIGLLALTLALSSPGIIATLFMVYTIFTSGLLVPVVAGFYRDELSLKPIGALAALIGGGAVAVAFGQTYPLLGMAVSAFLLVTVSWLNRHLKRLDSEPKEAAS